MTLLVSPVALPVSPIGQAGLGTGRSGPRSARLDCRVRQGNVSWLGVPRGTPEGDSRLRGPGGRGASTFGEKGPARRGVRLPWGKKTARVCRRDRSGGRDGRLSIELHGHHQHLTARRPLRVTQVMDRVDGALH